MTKAIAKRALLLVTATILFLPAGSLAQSGPTALAPRTRPERPYRGLFGGGVGETAQALTFDASLGGGPSLGSDPGLPGGQDLRGLGGGTITASTNLSYSMSREKFGFDASNVMLTDYQENSGSSGGWQLRDIAGASAFFVPFRPTRISLGLNYKNVPEVSASDFFDTQVGDNVPIGQDIGLTVERYNRYGTSLDVTQRLSRRASANFGVSYAHGFLKSHQWTILTYGGGLTVNLAKGLALSGGYQDGGQQEIRGDLKLPRDRRPRTTFGIDFNRQLSFSRRTNLSFWTGTAGTYDAVLGETNYSLIGSVKLDRDLGRSWYASLIYGRNVRYIESENKPLFSDAVTAGIQGSFTRRVQLQSRFGLMKGRLGRQETPEQETETTSYFATSKVSYALSRALSISADYTYHTYKLPANLVLDGTSDENHYQSIRTYIELWVPLITRRRN